MVKLLLSLVCPGALVLSFFCPGALVLFFFCPGALVLSFFCPGALVLSLVCPGALVLSLVCPGALVLSLVCPDFRSCKMAYLEAFVYPTSIYDLIGSVLDLSNSFVSFIALVLSVICPKVLVLSLMCPGVFVLVKSLICLEAFAQFLTCPEDLGLSGAFSGLSRALGSVSGAQGLCLCPLSANFDSVPDCP